MDKDLLYTGKKGRYEHYTVVPTSVMGARSTAMAGIATQYGNDSNVIFDEDTDGIATYKPITVGRKTYLYVPYGEDDDMPATVRRLIGENMVTAQCMAFNVLSCYGQGLRFKRRDDMTDATDDEIRSFCMRNSVQEVFMEQATDMKYYYFTVTEIVLSGDASRIVQMRHLESCYCRFEKARGGKVEHVFYGDFSLGNTPTKAVAIELLDQYDPLGDLLVRLGREPDPMTGRRRRATTERKFAIVCRMPTPGFRYYPIPYYMSIFRDNWYDIYKLIGLGKKYMIKNTSAPRIQIEVHDEYWDRVCDLENITDPQKRVERIIQERENIVNFVCGPENAGKAIVTHYYIDPNGKENRMVRINNLTQGQKEGGDWSEDMSEAANSLCFALGVHPNLIGATPGKSQMNNSGSDKRELFTLKQATEKPFHDIMGKPWHTVLHFNGWDKTHTISVPMIELTTLDENKSSKVVAPSNSPGGGGR